MLLKTKIKINKFLLMEKQQQKYKGHTFCLALAKCQTSLVSTAQLS